MGLKCTWLRKRLVAELALIYPLIRTIVRHLNMSLSIHHREAIPRDRRKKSKHLEGKKSVASCAALKYSQTSRLTYTWTNRETSTKRNNQKGVHIRHHRVFVRRIHLTRGAVQSDSRYQSSPACSVWSAFISSHDDMLWFVNPYKHAFSRVCMIVLLRYHDRFYGIMFHSSSPLLWLVIAWVEHYSR